MSYNGILDFSIENVEKSTEKIEIAMNHLEDQLASLLPYIVSISESLKSLAKTEASNTINDLTKSLTTLITTTVITQTVVDSMKKGFNLTTLALNGLIAVGMVAAIYVLGELTAKIVKFANESYFANSVIAQSRQQVDSLVDSYGNLKDSIDESNETYKEKDKQILQTYVYVANLLNETEALIKADGDLADSQGKIKTNIDLINEAMPGLNLEYSANNELMLESISLAKRRAGEITRLARAEAARKFIVDQAMKEYEIQSQIMALEQERDKLLKNPPATKEYTVGRETYVGYANGYEGEAYEKELERINALEAERRSELEQLGATIDATAEKYTNLTQANEDHAIAMAAQEWGVKEQELRDFLESTGMSIEEWEAQQEEILARREERMNSYVDAATNMFDRINTESDISIDDMIDNLHHNGEAITALGDNLALMGAQVANGLDEGLYQKMLEAGPEAAGMVAAIAESINNDDGKWEELNAAFIENGEAAIAAFGESMGMSVEQNPGDTAVEDVASAVLMNPALTDATIQMITDAKAAMAAEVTAQEFDSVGKQIVNGMIAGLNTQSGYLYTRMREIVKSSLAAAQSEAEINSPSRLFREGVGKPIMLGWEAGIEDERKGVLDAITDTVSDMKDAASTKLNFIMFGDGLQKLSAIAAAAKNGAAQRLQAMVAMSQLQLAPAAVGGYGGGAGAYVDNRTYLEQTIHSGTALQPSQMSREAEDMLRRSKWQIK